MPQRSTFNSRLVPEVTRKHRNGLAATVLGDDFRAHHEHGQRAYLLPRGLDLPLLPPASGRKMAQCSG